ncbi:MAG: glycoside hydrolase family 2 TIM barrel-domain containing protein, partial [Eubacteriales bacterium]|nr:glycoside hydrolase family 2 TIM barrel-domain containing protein [Eubacteriales bacterium]
MGSARRSFVMDKEWKFFRGDIDTGIKGSHTNSYNVSKAGGLQGAASITYDDSEWRVLNLPHDWFSESGFSPDNLVSHGYKTRSNGWYRKTFRLDASLQGRHISICFEGLAVTAEIYLNGSLMTRSFSAYAELPVDITDRVWFGSRPNVLAVYIGGLATEGWWYEGAGIYRHVRLFAKDMLHIAHNGLWVKPVFKNNTQNDWYVELETTIENSAYEKEVYSFKAAIYDGDEIISECLTEHCRCDSDTKSLILQRFDINDPERWDIKTPKLYTMKVWLLKNNVIVDEDSIKFGFRTIAIDPDKGFFLNGKPLKLKGTCNHQDHAGVGVAVPDSIQYYRIRRLKEMGTNAYRCSHNMPAREILDACDSLGMVVMDENRRFESRPEVLAHVEMMVRRDRN